VTIHMASKDLNDRSPVAPLITSPVERHFPFLLIGKPDDSCGLSKFNEAYRFAGSVLPVGSNESLAVGVSYLASFPFPVHICRSRTARKSETQQASG
jgi:hypothetical protein